MKKTLLITLLLVLLAAVTASAETLYTTSGSGNGALGRTYEFYATSNGSGWIEFTQSMGLCQRLRMTKPVVTNLGTTNEWGRYHIYYTVNGVRREKTWNAEGDNSTCKLFLVQNAPYRIEIVPFTMEEMVSQPAEFASWLTEPYWWVNNYSGCTLSLQEPVIRQATVRVNYVDEYGYSIDTQVLTLDPGTHTINAKSISGYNVLGTKSYTVTVQNDGYASMSTVTFRYQKVVKASVKLYYVDEYGNSLGSANKTFTQGTHTVSPKTISGYNLIGTRSYKVTVYSDGTVSQKSFTFTYQKKVVAPDPVSGKGYRPETAPGLFRPATVTGNQGEQTPVERLNDGSLSTAYQYVVWSSEFKDNGHQELTFTFHSSSVSGIWLWTGDQSSPTAYKKYSRPREMRVTIRTSSGTYTETMKPKDLNDCQKLPFTRTYSNVKQIDIDILRLHTGSNKNFVRISELAFY